MFSDIMHGVMITMSPDCLLALCIGAMFGTVVGALPGLGTAVAITICIPFTLQMGNASAIALLLGVYLPRSNMFDVWMALLIGVIAFLMRFADFPVAPFLIGYVLSAQLEYRLGQAVIYKGDMPLTEYLFSAPVALVLFAVSACLLLAPMLRPLWAGRRK